MTTIKITDLELMGMLIKRLPREYDILMGDNCIAISLGYEHITFEFDENGDFI